MKRLLIINIARLGDLLQSSPLIQGLKRQGEVELTFLVPDVFAEVAGMIPGVDRVATLPMEKIVTPLMAPRGGMMTMYRSLETAITGLRATPFDQILNITHSAYSAVLTALIARGTPAEIAGISLDADGSRFVGGQWANYYLNVCSNRLFNRFNLVDIHRQIGGAPPIGGLSVTIPDVERDRADELIRASGLSGRRLVAVIPAASTREKQWAPGLMIKTLQGLKRITDATPILLGAAKEQPLGDKIVAEVPDTVNLCGKTSVALMGAILERCELCITNDTGPMHMAAAVGTPILDISLGSALSHETAPYGTGHIVVESRIRCYPCLPKLRCSHYSCHGHIAPELVSKLAAAMLERRLPEQIPDDLEYAGINIHRTGFDADGWWRLRPVIRRELTQAELSNHALREMWRRTLNALPAWAAQYLASAGDLGRELASHYESVERSLDPASAEAAARTVAGLARSGLSASGELARYGDGRRNVSRIMTLGATLKQVDTDLARIGHATPELAPLIAQFIYGKNQLTGDRLGALARGTAELYRNLAEWTLALPKWVRGIQNGLTGIEPEGVKALAPLPQAIAV